MKTTKIPFLPTLHKYEFAFVTGVTKGRLRKMLQDSAADLERLGYRKYDKMLNPIHVRYLLERYGLEIDFENFKLTGLGVLKVALRRSDNAQ